MELSLEEIHILIDALRCLDLELGLGERGSILDARLREVRDRRMEEIRRGC